MKLTKTCAKFLRKHGGTILAIGASIGVGLTMWETGKATVKATTLVTMNKDEPMTKKEIVKDCWKFYVPAAVAGAGTVACILGSNALNKKQLASMTAAYMALGKAYQEYRSEVAERIGAEEEKKLRMEVAEKTKGEDVQRDKDGDVIRLFYEPASKRYFHATEIELTDAFYNANRYFALNGELSMNDFTSYLPGLDFTPEGDTLGWCAEYLTNEWEYYWIDFNYYKQTTDDGLEVYYVEAFQEPIKEFLDYDVMKRHLDYKGV